MMAELVLSSPTINTKCRRFPPQSQTVSAGGSGDLAGGVVLARVPWPRSRDFFFFFFQKSLSGTEKKLRWSEGRLTGAGSVSAEQLPGEFCLNV